MNETLVKKLLEKRANYARTLTQCDVRVMQAERALNDAREARAGAQTGLQVLDETLEDMRAADLAEKQAGTAPAAPSTPAGSPRPVNGERTAAAR